MKRREMLRGLGLSLGALAITPSIASLLQSCASEEKISWTAQFFKQEQLPLLNKIVNIILPKTEDLPSATEVNVPQFIDKFAAEVLEPEVQELFKKGFLNFSNLFSYRGDEPVNFNNIETEAIEAEISKLLKKTKAEHEAIMKTFGEAMQNETEIPEDALNYVTIDGLRGLSIFAYKSSEYIAEEVLTYLPVPGKQEGCVDVEEATGGKAYALD